MKLQGTQATADLLQREQTAGTSQTRMPDIPFKNLLDGALQIESSKPDSQKAQKESAKTDQAKPSRDEPAKQDSLTSRQKPEVSKSQDSEAGKSPEKTDEQAAAAVAATLIAPMAAVITPEAAEETLNIANIGTHEAQAGPIHAALPEQAQMPQPAQEPSIQPQLQGSIISAELTIAAPELAEPSVQQTVTVQQPTDESAQNRFDALVAKASRQLQDARIQEQAVQSDEPDETASTDQSLKTKPSQPEQAVPRKAPRPEEQLSEAQEKPITTDSQKPAIRTVEQPRQVFTTSPTEQIRAQVIENLETQKMEFRMQLEPRELGKLDVRMVLESGKMAVHVIASTSKTAELLQRQSEGLASSLRMAGIQVETVQIVQETQTTEGHMDGAFNMLGQQSGGRQQAGDSGTRHFSGGGETHQGEAAKQILATDPERLLDAAV